MTLSLTPNRWFKTENSTINAANQVTRFNETDPAYYFSRTLLSTGTGNPANGFATYDSTTKLIHANWSSMSLNNILTLNTKCSIFYLTSTSSIPTYIVASNIQYESGGGLALLTGYTSNGVFRKLELYDNSPVMREVIDSDTNTGTDLQLIEIVIDQPNISVYQNNKLKFVYKSYNTGNERIKSLFGVISYDGTSVTPSTADIYFGDIIYYSTLISQETRNNVVQYYNTQFNLNIPVFTDVVSPITGQPQIVPTYKDVTIHGQSGVGTDYNIKFNLHYTEGNDYDDNVFLNYISTQNFSDVRFKTTDGTSLNYWITDIKNDGTDAATATAWVKIASNLDTDQTIRIEYGSGETTSTSSGADTFIFFDDFSGNGSYTNLDTTTKWTGFNLSLGGVTFDNNQLHITSTKDIRTKNTYSNNILGCARIKTVSIANGSGGYWPIGFHSSNFAYLNHYGNDYVMINGGYRSLAYTTPEDGSYLKYEVSKSSSFFKYNILYDDNNIFSTITETAQPINRADQLVIGIRPGINNATINVYYDYVYIRKYIESYTPTFTWSSSSTYEPTTYGGVTDTEITSALPTSVNYESSSKKYILQASDFNTSITSITGYDTTDDKRERLKRAVIQLKTLVNLQSDEIIQVERSALPFSSIITKTNVSVAPDNVTLNLSDLVANDSAVYASLDEVGSYLHVNTLTNGQYVIITKTETGYTVNETGTITSRDVGYSSTYDGFVYEIGSYSGQPTGSGSGTAPCFCPGTLIKTPTGNVPIELLKDGDVILTNNNKVVPIKIYSFSVKNTTKLNAPYCIPKNSIGNNYPTSDLYISPEHAIVLSDKLFTFAHMLSQTNPKIKQVNVGKKQTYYHIETPDYLNDVIYANDLPVETYANKQIKLPNRVFYKHIKNTPFFTRFISNKTYNKRISL